MNPQIAAARELWDSGHAIDAGRTLYRMLPAEARPGWAVGVLDVCWPVLNETIPEVEAVRAIARTPSRWREAHAAFSAVRNVVLAEERTGRGGELRALLLSLTELVAKVTYNASGGDAPFDHHAGWRIASAAKSIVDLVKRDGLDEDVWNALASVIC